MAFTRLTLKLFATSAALGVACSFAQAQSFSLDDNPKRNPFFGFGGGAEDEFGLTGATLAPSPSLVIGVPPLDGAIYSPKLPMAGPGFLPNGNFVDAFTTAKTDVHSSIPLLFSVDRMGQGLPGSALAVEAAANQQPGDIYRTTKTFPNPSTYIPFMPNNQLYTGALPSAGVGGPGSNTLLYNQSVFGLTVVGAPGALTPPGVWVPPAIPGSHDNVDAFDLASFVAGGAPLYGTWSYFSIAPDEAVVVGASAANIWDVQPMAPGAVAAAPYALAPMLGLDSLGPNTDSIDALVMWDLNLMGGPQWGGPGAQPGIDFALFSLSAGSASLAAWGLNEGDIFFTTFNGSFGTFAFSTDLGVVPGNNLPFGPGNIDALEIPEPASAPMAAVMLGAPLLWLRRRR